MSNTFTFIFHLLTAYEQHFFFKETIKTYDTVISLHFSVPDQLSSYTNNPHNIRSTGTIRAFVKIYELPLIYNSKSILDQV